MTTATTADRRKRVFSDRTLTLGDLCAIHAQLAGTGHDVVIEANDTRLFDVEQLPALAIEEVFLRSVTMDVIGADEESLQFVYDPGYIEVECGPDPAFRRPFAVVCALLDAKPRNAEHGCGLDLASAGLPTLPAVAMPEEATTRVHRRADRTAPAAVGVAPAPRVADPAAARATTERIAAPRAAAPAVGAGAADRVTDYGEREHGRSSAVEPAASAGQPPTANDGGATTAPSIVDHATPPSRGLIAALRRLWGGR